MFKLLNVSKESMFDVILRLDYYKKKLKVEVVFILNKILKYIICKINVDFCFFS